MSPARKTDFHSDEKPGRREDDKTLKEILVEFKAFHQDVTALKEETHAQTMKLDKISGDISSRQIVIFQPLGVGA